jgi:hypothetical protein
MATALFRIPEGLTSMHSNLAYKPLNCEVCVALVSKETTGQDSKANTQRKTHQEEFFDGDSCTHRGNGLYRSNCPAKGFCSSILDLVRHPSEGSTCENRRCEDEDCKYYTIWNHAECVACIGREVSHRCFRDLFLSAVLCGFTGDGMFLPSP